jgi:hypothetical protein
MAIELFDEKHYVSKEVTDAFVARHGIGEDSDNLSDEKLRIATSLRAIFRIARLRQNDGSGVENLDYIGQVDITEPEDYVLLRRRTAELSAGERTRLAYRTEAAPVQRLDVVKGAGSLMLGSPDAEVMTARPFDAANDEFIDVPHGHFYFLEASPTTREALVVSGFTKVRLAYEELPALEGQQFVNAREGSIAVPFRFQEMTAAF